MGLTITSTIDLGAVTDRVIAAAPEALRVATEHIREVAVELTPLEEGTLRRSAKVHVVEGDVPAASITYDGPYARYQHEKLELRHETGQAKFLETAFQVEAQAAKDIVAQQLRQALG